MSEINSQLLQEEHHKDRKMSKLGSTIASGAATTDLHVAPDQALYIMEYGKMGKVGYTTLRLSMLPFGVFFPQYDEVSKHKKEHVVPAQKVWGDCSVGKIMFDLLLSGGVQRQPGNSDWVGIQVSREPPTLSQQAHQLSQP